MITLVSQRFQKTIERFICLRCGTEVVGDGYTNHCTECFSSLHVDINPGDRAATCRGLMSVIGVELEHGQWVLVHQCDVCGFVRRNRVQANDNMAKLAKLQQRLNHAITHGQS